MSGHALPRLLAGAKEVCTQKILVAARAAGLELKLEAPRAGQVGPELHRADQVVRHTGAILRYVGRVFEGTDVYGTTFAESAQVDSWLDWGEMELGPAEPPRLTEAIEVLEKHLDSRVFLVGDRYTLADASIGCSLYQFQREGLTGSLPRATQRWLSTCTAQPAFVEVVGAVAAPAAAAAAAPAAAARPAAPAAPAAAAAAAAFGGAGVVASYSRCVGGRTHVARILNAPDGGKSLIGTEVSVCGWVKTMRDQATAIFLEVNDGSCPGNIQVVIDKAAKGTENMTAEGKCGTGASVRCTGKLVEPPKGAKQTVELVLTATSGEFKLFGGVDAKSYPLAKGRHGMEFLRTIAHLRPRSNLISAVARVRSALAFATHEFFRSRGFLYVHTPLITAADCEGAGEMFQVTTMMGDEKKGIPKTKDGKIDYSQDFFGKPSYLTVSGQLSVENYACALSSVYTFGPTFRAENSHTSRHLAEFWMIEPEIAFADIYDDMDCAEEYLKFCVQYVMDHHKDDLEFFDERVEKGLIKRLENLLAEPFGRLTYTEAIDILIKESPKAKFSVPVEWGMDMGSEHERYLAEKVYKKPIIVYNYPAAIKSFYMRLNDDGKTVAAMDCLVPQIGEVIGGSQREERLENLDQMIEAKGLEAKDYWWYRDLRKYGSVPHSGFGLGFERLIMLTTGVENIRDTIPFPRYPGHAEF